MSSLQLVDGKIHHAWDLRPDDSQRNPRQHYHSVI
jgi:hypothetical protein